MTRRRRILLSAAVLVACACLALGVLAMLPAQPGVTEANFDRLREGMTRAEVESLFGKGSAGQWGGDDVWNTNEFEAFVWIKFDGDDRVLEKSWVPDERSVFEKLADRLPWRSTPRVHRYPNMGLPDK